MQRTKLEAHTNFNRKPDIQNAITEKPIAHEANFLNQKVLKPLEIFNQNRFGKHLSTNSVDAFIIEKEGHMTFTCLGKPSLSVKQTPCAPIRRHGRNCA